MTARNRFPEFLGGTFYGCIFLPTTEELSGQHWYGISYLRLSKLGKRYESESIDNQRKLIDEFVQRHPEITLVGERVDDGYTGTNYDRPAFRALWMPSAKRRQTASL